MNKKMSFLLMLMLCVCFAGCSASPHAFYAESGNTEFILSADETLSEICSASDTIVKAEFKTKTEVSDSIWEYEFTLDTVFAGDVSAGDKIFVYDELDPSAFQSGYDYYLFLSSHYDPAYPHIIYSRNSKGFLPRQKGRRLEFLNGSNLDISTTSDLDAVINDIATYSRQSRSIEDFDYSSAADAAEDADKVFVVKITEETAINLYISSFKVQVVEELKGSADNLEFNIAHSSDFEIDDELVYLSADSWDKDITYGSKFGIMAADSADGISVLELLR